MRHSVLEARGGMGVGSGVEEVDVGRGRGGEGN